MKKKYLILFLFFLVLVFVFFEQKNASAADTKEDSNKFCLDYCLKNISNPEPYTSFNTCMPDMSKNQQIEVVAIEALRMWATKYTEEEKLCAKFSPSVQTCDYYNNQDQEKLPGLCYCFQKTQDNCASCDVNSGTCLTGESCVSGSKGTCEKINRSNGTVCPDPEKYDVIEKSDCPSGQRCCVPKNSPPTDGDDICKNICAEKGYNFNELSKCATDSPTDELDFITNYLDEKKICKKISQDVANCSKEEKFGSCICTQTVYSGTCDKEKDQNCDVGTGNCNSDYGCCVKDSDNETAFSPSNCESNTHYDNCKEAGNLYSSIDPDCTTNTQVAQYCTTVKTGCCVIEKNDSSKFGTNNCKSNSKQSDCAGTNNLFNDTNANCTENTAVNQYCKGGETGNCGPDETTNGITIKSSCIEKSASCTSERSEYNSVCGADKKCCWGSRIDFGITKPIPVYCDENSRGVVPCGRNCDDPSTSENETIPCTLCHLLIGIKKLFDFGLKLAITAAFVAIFFAGTIYIVSTGDEGMMGTAKKMLSAALIGFTLVLAAWLVVNVILWIVSAKDAMGVKSGANWWTFTCDTTSSARLGTLGGGGGTGGGGGSGSGGGGGGQTYTKEECEKWCDEADGDANWTASCKQGCQQNGQPTTPTGQGLSQADAQKALDACGVKYSSAYSLGGLRDTTVKEACDFKKSSGCTPQITSHGGTNGNHASGTYSHANGYKLDYAIASCLDNYIKSNYSYKGVRSDGAKMYQSASGACYAREGDHWDVSTASCPPSK